MNKIFFSEWTDQELTGKPRCKCECHSYPGIYPTNDMNPCHICGHINQYGYFPEGHRNISWVEYWRSDKAGIYGSSERV